MYKLKKMKKIFLGLAVAASSIAFGQQFGAKAGLNVSSMTKDGTLSDQKSKIGFNAGIFANFPVGSNFSIQPEVLYSQYGDKEERTVDNSTVSWGRHLDYITIPVMAQYNIVDGLFVEFGPEFGFMVNDKFKVKNETSNSTISESSLQAQYPYNKFNFGLGIGGGYWFTENIGLNVRYVAGMTDATENVTVGGQTFDDNTKNNVFQAGLNFKF